MKLHGLLGPGEQIRTGRAQTEITGLTADSRQVGPGFLFAALPGTRHDGRRYIAEAIAAGAVAVLAPEGTPPPETGDVAFITSANPRRALALAAAAFYAPQPAIVAAVTGTNGKTSVASFLRQIWSGLGEKAGFIGTTGMEGPDVSAPAGLTTPDPVQLHAALNAFARSGVTHVALEASSHGLEQHRLDGLRLTAGAFTNISRDHLDYHGSFADYFAQKKRLFGELLPAGAGAVIDRDAHGAEEVEELARRRDLTVFTVGRTGEDLRLVAVERQGLVQKLDLEVGGRRSEVCLPLAGDFQVANALVAAGLAIVCAWPPHLVLPRLAHLRGASGRLELVGHTRSGAPVFVDFAHTPDALETVLNVVRPYTRGRLWVVFGAGGDRDRGKRPLMGAVAAACADEVIVTDDNPRSEDPAAIRAAIRTEVPHARDIGDREEAIRTAVAALGPDDVLVVAGKGHESGQIMADKVLPLQDQDVV
ncbi:MAG TPA: UDP-N-acetylmuramoyl-L-alanyl-D-glutamate--2,6-diaminopimelate ligase, partial [Rhodobacteraceae bacterium]|nr:UDP-N-acetylmuramoyl-L-alanyl-D-glutamate--2,6-diaminopimelate ligase [Paracoccaceae bacterium]